MNSDRSKLLLVLLLPLGVVALFAALLRPQYVADYGYLSLVIFAEVMTLAIWKYSQRIFLLLIVVFLWAGTDIPLSGTWTSRRWFVLAIVAVAGFGIYLRDPRHHFGAPHAVALFCVVSALISAMVSSYPKVATLKALSLLLLFAYAAAGARLAIAGRQGKFLFGLLLACECLTYVTAIGYFVVHHSLFGNPNSLGAVMGICVIPVLLWGVFVSERKGLRSRRTFALVLAMVLLLSSYARAGLAAAAVSCILLCLASRQYRLLIKGATLVIVAALLITTVAPLRAGESDSLLSAFVYKGEKDAGVLESRRSVWQISMDSIRQHPLFGTGFGTVASSYDAVVSPTASYSSVSVATREHGNSYLATTEWVGLLGVIPFFGLVIMVASRAARVMVRLRKTADPYSAAVPLAAVVIAGVVHATFEDWLFAVGYYMCVFFWSLGFMLFDVAPAADLSPSKVAAVPRTWPEHLGATSPAQ
jgi:O-antigen ligase